MNIFDHTALQRLSTDGLGLDDIMTSSSISLEQSFTGSYIGKPIVGKTTIDSSLYGVISIFLIFSMIGNFIASMSGLFSIPISILLMIAASFFLYEIFVTTDTATRNGYILLFIFCILELFLMPLNFFSGLIFGNINFMIAVIEYIVNYLFNYVF